MKVYCLCTEQYNNREINLPGNNVLLSYYLESYEANVFDKYGKPVTYHAKVYACNVCGRKVAITEN